MPMEVRPWREFEDFRAAVLADACDEEPVACRECGFFDCANICKEPV